MSPKGHAPGTSPPDSEAEATLQLLTAARAGDREAVDRLFARYIPGLRQWAHGRLPVWARDVTDTHDLVQETVLRVFKRLDGFEYRGEGALKAYLRQALMNRIRNEIRRSRSQPERGELDTGIEDRSPSPIARAIDGQERELYETALQRLSAAEREAIIARVELGLSYQEMAKYLSKTSPDAARMAVTRAIVRLTEEMALG